MDVPPDFVIERQGVVAIIETGTDVDFVPGKSQENIPLLVLTPDLARGDLLRSELYGPPGELELNSIDRLLGNDQELFNFVLATGNMKQETGKIVKDIGREAGLDVLGAVAGEVL